MKKSFLEIFSILRIGENLLDVLSIRNSKYISDKVIDKDKKFELDGNKIFTPFNMINGHEEFLNLNVQYTQKGTVEVDGKEIECSEFKSKNIINNGKINAGSFDALVDDDTFNMLDGVDGIKYQGTFKNTDDKEYKVLHIKTKDMELTSKLFEKMSYMNLSITSIKAMVQQVETLKARTKVLRFCIDNLEKSLNVNAAPLKSEGIDKNGFYKPVNKEVKKHEQREEQYCSFKIKGLSAPSINALNKKISEGKKLNNGDLLLQNELKNVNVEPNEKGLEKLNEQLSTAKRELSKLKLDLVTIKLHKSVNNTWWDLERDKKGNLIFEDLVIEIGEKMA